eukprot:4581188-Amphidinium_carterae.1
MTGWTVAAEPRKNLGFSECFVALGVCFEIKCALEGQIVVSNEAERIADMRAEIDSIVEAGRISSKQAAQIRGKLSFAELRLNLLPGGRGSTGVHLTVVPMEWDLLL